MKKRLFTGYSTIDLSKDRSWVLYDLELIKRDLLNHFMTRKGERILRPTFGCSIWSYIHEPLTPEIVDRIEEEVTRIVTLDSRTETRRIVTETYRHGVVVLVDLYYRPYDIEEQFRIEFEGRQ